MLKPIFKIKETKKEKDFRRFFLEPLPRGFGNTLGNALRRVLLSNLKGAAVSRIKIKGTRHQFSTISGLKEDMVEFILNLKKVNFSLKGEKEAVLTLSKKGPGKIKASDIKTPPNVVISNKDEYLASLSDKKSKFEVKIWIEQGTGYISSEERKFSEVGIIPVDSVFSPVRRVNYKVEETRVGRATNFDRLILEVWSNGAVSPLEALNEGAKILVSYFRHIYEPKEINPEELNTKTVSETILKTPVDELDLPIRIVNALKKGGYETFGDLHGESCKNLEKVRNLGGKSISLVKEKLREKGVKLS